MSKGVNKVILVGRLGQDPELNYTDSGTAVCNMRMATGDSHTNRDSERVDTTEWHDVVDSDYYCPHHTDRDTMPPDTVKHQKQDTRQLAPEREHATETTVAARVSHSTKAALKQLAEERGTDISKLVARLIRQELAQVADK